MAFGTAALVNFGKESIKLASDIQEVQNVIDVTFGKGAAQIEEFAQSAAEAYGLSELAAKQYTGTMGAMLKSSGLATSAAQEMSVALAGLSGDIASFYNLDTDEAFQKIRAGISGETEPLKQLGINMSVANLEAYALSKGITKSYNAMSQAEQVLLRYNYLLSVTTDAQGDFARTSGSFANQIRILQLNFDQLRIAVGNALIPIAQAVLPSINAIISGLTKLAKVFAQVTALLFGKSPEVKATSGIAASAGAAADATDKLAESTAGAGSAAKQAEKDMKGVLASFDELNVLANRASDSVGGAGGGLSGAGSDLDIPGFEAETGGELFGDAEISPKLLKEIEELKDGLSRIWEVFKKSWEINGPGVVEAAKRALSSIYGLLKSIGTAFTEAWTGGAGLDFLNAVFALLETVLNIIADIADAWKTAFDNEGVAFFESILFRLTAMLELINSIGEAFREVWNNGTGVEICETILRILTDINNIFGTIYTKIQEAWEANGNGVAIWQAILDVVQTVLNFVERLTSATLEWAQGLNLEPLVTAFRNLLEAINPLVEVITDGLAYAYENVLLPFGKWVLEELAPVGIELVTVAIETLTAILETLEPLATWLWENFLQPLAKWTGDLIISALETLIGLLNDIGDWISENKATLIEIGEAVTSLYEDHIKPFVEDVVKSFQEWYDKFKEGYEQNIKPVLDEFVKRFGEVVKEHVIPLVEKLLEFIGKVIDVLNLLWDNVLKPFLEWLDTDMAEGIGETLAFVGEIFNGLLTIVSDVVGGILEALGGVLDFLIGIFTGDWERAWDGVCNIFKGIWNTIVGTLEGAINLIISGINWLIKQLNKVKFDFPDWIPAIGGKSFGINIPSVSEVKLPRLANGAVIPPNQQFAAILGDQRSGKNLEAPAALVRQMVQEGMQAAMAQGGFNRGGNMTVIMEIDGREFGRASYRYGTAEQQRVGVRLAEVRA